VDDRDWWQLHLRVALGEELSAEERAVYEAEMKRLDENESYPGNLALLKQLRADGGFGSGAGRIESAP
jgi:beta-phosphoglucomutase-like phosphatase (HAD superfamily)